MESRRDVVESDSVGITRAKSGMGVQTSIVSLGKRTARSGGGLGTRCRTGSDSDGRHGGNRLQGAERYWWGGSGGSVVRRAEREPREGGLADCGSALPHRHRWPFDFTMGRRLLPQPISMRSRM